MYIIPIPLKTCQKKTNKITAPALYRQPIFFRKKYIFILRGNQYKVESCPTTLN